MKKFKIKTSKYNQLKIQKKYVKLKKLMNKTFQKKNKLLYLNNYNLQKQYKMKIQIKWMN